MLENIYLKIKDEFIARFKKTREIEKNTQQYIYSISMGTDEFENVLGEEITKDEQISVWADYKKFGYDNLWYNVYIAEIPIIEKEVSIKKIYEHLNKKIKEKNYKISPSDYMKDITYKEYKKR